MRGRRSERYGSDFRLTELQSAIGRIQLQCLPEWTAARTRNALLLAEALANCPAVRVPLPSGGITHAWYKFFTFVKAYALAEGGSRDRILGDITALGYPALSGSCSEIDLEKCSRRLVSHLLSGCLWRGSSGRPVWRFLCIPPLPLSRWLAMPGLCGLAGRAGS